MNHRADTDNQAEAPSSMRHSISVRVSASVTHHQIILQQSGVVNT